MPGSRLRRLMAALTGSHLNYLEQVDGSRYYFNPEALELFLFGIDSLKGHYRGEPLAEPPELVHAIANAKDRRAALIKVFGEVTVSMLPYELEPLVERGELVERSLVAGHPLAHEPLKDLSVDAPAQRDEEES